MLAGHLRSLKPGFSVIESKNMDKTLGEYCRKRRIRSVAIDKDAVSFALAGRIKTFIQVVPVSSPITALRAVKGSTELSAIRKACRIAAGACRYARKLCNPGISEIALYYKIEEYFARNRVKASFPTIIAFGPNSANPHHVPGSRKLRKNDTILMDLGCVWKGYCSDLTHTFLFGKMTGLQMRVFSCVKHAQQAGLDAVRAGVLASEVDAAARGLIAKGGYGKNFIHTTGHGVGIDIHEAPRISAKDKTTLEAGMVITVEPGVYLPGKFGVRIEDTVLVTKNGFEILTKE
jgi:Xaa-Pro aminopeptidase